MDETHRRRVEQTAPGPQEATPRVLSLSEVATRLKMKPSNVAKFLARRGVRPAFAKAQGYFWWESEIETIREEREADVERRRADERRRRGALEGGQGRQPRPPRVRLGKHQAELMLTMLRRPARVEDNATRLALRRLRLRGLVEPVGNGTRAYQLTDAGREAVKGL